MKFFCPVVLLINTEPTTQCLLSLLGLHLSQIEFQFSSLQDVAISASALSGAAGNSSQQTAGGDLFLKSGFDLGYALAELVFLFSLLGSGLVKGQLFGFSLE